MSTYIERNRGFITYSKLKAFRYCQYLYKLQYIDEVVPEKESDALLFGNAFDTLVQGEDLFMNKFAAVSKRGEKAEKENPGKILITEKQHETLRMCLNEFRRQPLCDPGGDKQVEMVVDYKGQKIKATMDKLFLDAGIIKDVKTAASLSGLTNSYNGIPTIQSYKDQLTFYQFIVQFHTDRLFDGVLEVVTKEDPPRSQFYKATAQSLLDNRPSLISTLDQMIETINLGIFSSCERQKCLECEAYGICPYAIQKEFIQI